MQFVKKKAHLKLILFFFYKLLGLLCIHESKRRFLFSGFWDKAFGPVRFMTVV